MWGLEFGAGTTYKDLLLDLTVYHLTVPSRMPNQSTKASYSFPFWGTWTGPSTAKRHRLEIF